MSTKKIVEEMVPVEEESIEIVTKEEVTKDKMLLSQYFDRFAPNTDKYIKSFVSVPYHGILKTKEEWDSELVGKF